MLVCVLKVELKCSTFANQTLWKGLKAEMVPAEANKRLETMGISKADNFKLFGTFYLQQLWLVQKQRGPPAVYQWPVCRTMAAAATSKRKGNNY